VAAAAFPPVVFYYVQHTARFSGDASVDMDSAIDMIRTAKRAGLSTLYLYLEPGVEELRFGAAHDIGPGASLTQGGVSFTNVDSPALVEIDGGGRTIDLTGGTAGCFITVGAEPLLRGFCGRPPLWSRGSPWPPKPVPSYKKRIFNKRTSAVILLSNIKYAARTAGRRCIEQRLQVIKTNI
jgi:hypothetical protein